MLEPFLQTILLGKKRYCLSSCDSECLWVREFHDLDWGRGRVDVKSSGCW